MLKNPATGNEVLKLRVLKICTDFSPSWIYPLFKPRPAAYARMASMEAPTDIMICPSRPFSMESTRWSPRASCREARKPESPNSEWGSQRPENASSRTPRSVGGQGPEPSIRSGREGFTQWMMADPECDRASHVLSVLGTL